MNKEKVQKNFFLKSSKISQSLLSIGMEPLSSVDKGICIRQNSSYGVGIFWVEQESARENINFTLQL